MSTYLSPGVYVEEVPSGPQPIAAAPTSVVAILGTTRRGPVLEPTRVTGWADFVRRFGAATRKMPFPSWAFKGICMRIILSCQCRSRKIGQERRQRFSDKALRADL